MYSTLYQLDSSIIKSEAEVETRFLQKLFIDLGYPIEAIVPKNTYTCTLAYRWTQKN